MENTYIYTLTDPITNLVRYIGKTNNPDQRFKAHINKARKESNHRINWIKSLRDKNLKPIMEIIDTVSIEEWQFWEVFWIAQFKSWGFKLLNFTGGGDGCTFGNKTSFKKGNESWNKGKKNIKECAICNIEFYCCKSMNKRTCSKECASIYRKQNLNDTVFIKGSKPWNKNKLGYTTSKKGCELSQDIKDKISNTLTGKPSKKKRMIKQYDKDMNFIKEFESITEAIIETGIKSISNVLTGRAKTAGGYIWQ